MKNLTDAGAANPAAANAQTSMPGGPNVGPSAQEHLAAQGLLQRSAAGKEDMKVIQPSESQLDDAIENSFPASDPIATTSEKVTKP